MKKLILTALLASTITYNVDAAPIRQDAVVDQKGSKVIDYAGNCIRTKWDEPGDPCQPEAPRQPQTVTPTPKPTPVMPAREARTIYFDFNKDSFKMSESAKLDSLVAWMAGAKGIQSAKVIGFADQIGNAKYNQTLSEKRAAAVQHYFKSKGVTIPTSVEVVKGLGDTQPVTNCDKKMKRAERINCLAADRRVEIEFDIVK